MSPSWLTWCAPHQLGAGQFPLTKRVGPMRRSGTALPRSVEVVSAPTQRAIVRSSEPSRSCSAHPTSASS